MSDKRDIPPAGDDPPPPIPLSRAGSTDGGDEPPRPRVYKVRLALILAGLAALALVSTVFGMMMAVASDLPQIEKFERYRNPRNSVLYDFQGRQLGILTTRNNRIIDRPSEIATTVKDSVIAIEDQRFYENQGIDVRGIGRALFADLTRRKAVQGASTITQQFVKNALAAQNQRTIFQKLRESALAYHLTRKWSKSKILTEYLNTVYFGNGAYGVESAAKVYFGNSHPECLNTPTQGAPRPPRCASQLTAPEAALLAAMIASPTAYDPLAHPEASRKRRNLVLDRMNSQGNLTKDARDQGKLAPLPTSGSVTFPKEDSLSPYFTTWVKQQVIDKFGAQNALNGGLQIRTSLDLDLQRAAEQAVNSHLANPDGPTASLVALDNKTGEVRAMVGGRDYNTSPFNLATQGQRQPGSSFKAFVLAAALQKGISPDSVWSSHRKEFIVPNSAGKERFVVRNYEGSYSGSNTLAGATTVSDNSIFAEVGIKTGIPRVARMARRLGIRTPVSENPAITLGGLKQGVTAMDMAHAYDTLAEHGQRITGSLGAPKDGPVGIDEVCQGSSLKDGQHCRHNEKRTIKVVSKELANTETGILQTVVCCGTGKAAAISGFAAGKTGTTENYGDAWFIGWSDRWTVAVWVGYPERLKSMQTDYNGGPVAGGTFPAEIWHDFINAANGIQDQRNADKAAQDAQNNQSTGPSTDTGTPTDTGPSTDTGPAPPSTPTQPQPSQPAQAPNPTPQPQRQSSPPAAGNGGGGGNPQPSPPPSSGGGTGAGGGAAPPG